MLHLFFRPVRGRRRRRWTTLSLRRVRRFNGAGLVLVADKRTVLLPGTTLPVIGRLSGPQIIDLSGAGRRYPAAPPKSQQQPIVWP